MWNLFVNFTRHLYCDNERLMTELNTRSKRDSALLFPQVNIPGPTTVITVESAIKYLPCL